MKRRSESDKSTDMIQVQVLVGPTTLNLIEAYRKKAGLYHPRPGGQGPDRPGPVTAACPRLNNNYRGTFKSRVLDTVTTVNRVKYRSILDFWFP
ncbi:hypothetical protein [Bosea vaviloviae]|uniref:hypothetical protein n=1 Tax=Bosea vaviloviae TaxID=1526658 RepID=UPI0011E04593|nr:hypothetical protein [Bosea vaviloviae]